MQKQRNSSYSPKLQQGQALLVIVLIMVVALTVGLSVATRSITNTRVATEEEDSQRAFSAAEAGAERLLDPNNTEPNTGGNVDIGKAQFNARVQATNTQQFLLNGGNQVVKDDGADIWLSNYKDFSGGTAGSITLYWGDTGTCSSNPQVAAIEVVLLYGPSTASPKATHFTFDPCQGAGSRGASNNFSPATAAGSQMGVPFTYSGSFTVPAASDPDPGPGFIARVIPLYNSTKIGVISSVQLPSQGKQVVSTGISGGTTRQISVYQSYPKLPIELFPYTIFSP